MANSTDVLQEKLERANRHSLYMLQSLRNYRDLFSSVCILTKNPGMLLDDPAYVEAVRNLRLEVQVSIAYWRDEVGKRLEPGAPLVSERRRAVERLVNEGVTVALRMDPLFPRGIQGCTEYQSLEQDLEPLVTWAAQRGVRYIITSPLKLVFRRNTVSWFNASVIKAFPEVRGGYRRMPEPLQKRLLADAKTLCQEHDLRLEHCFANILKRNAEIHESKRLSV
jgi:DNA repair photolyase